MIPRMLLWTVGVMTSSTLVPRFTVEPRSSVVRTGNSVALTCAVQPHNANIRWTLNGSTISAPAARRRGIELTRDGQLLIGAYNRLSSSPSSSSSASVAATGSRLSHDGLYQCAAVTQAGVIVSSEAKLQAACTLSSSLYSLTFQDAVLSVATWRTGRNICVVVDSVPFLALRENMTSSTKPEVHNVK